MRYRNNLSVLGMGCLRFPRDKTEAEKLILSAIDGGINIFDTAYIYPDSEATLGHVLAKNNRRKDVYIVTKLPHGLCKSGDDFEHFFNKQLHRLQTDFIDYYFIHNISNFAQWEKLRKWGIEAWLENKIKLGQIRKTGFSYHGSVGDFIKITESYPWDACMIQYNYYDEDYQAGRKGLLAAAGKDITVMIMEPLLGGRLATGLPKSAVEIFKKANPDLTPADWGLWWLWNQEQVDVVFSGMAALPVLEQNIRSADAFRQLTGKEQAVYSDVVAEFRKSYKIYCTGCNYCLPCPKGINIPGCFSAYNSSYAQSRFTGMKLYYTSIAVMAEKTFSAHNCNGCGVCEKQCPQGIPVRKALKQTVRRLEPFPLRLLLKLVRRVMRRKR